MAPTTTKTAKPKAPPQPIDDSGQTELAQQFKNAEDFTKYVVARIKQINPDVHHQLPLTESLIEETEQEAAPRKEKRIKGRRRAANPVANVEAAMRRQSEVKTAFRTITRPLKQVLDEMARRTVDELEANPQAHSRATEHQYVRAGLQTALDSRNAVINHGLEFGHAELKTRHDAEADILYGQFENAIEDAHDRIMDEIDYEMIDIDRRSRLQNAIENQDTDDEDDVILRPHATSYRFDRGDALNQDYDSRSRLHLDVDRAQDQLETRQDMQDLLEDQDVEYAPGHTVMDSSVRDIAQAHRQGLQGVDMLCRASQQVESEARKKRRKQTPLHANRDAESLMELANIATKSRNLLRTDMPPPTTPRRRPSTAGRLMEQDDVYVVQARKRSQTGMPMSAPLKRQHDQISSHGGFPMAGVEPEMKQEARSPSLQQNGQPYQQRLPIDLSRMIDGHGHGRRMSEDFIDRRLERQGSVMSRANLDRRFFGGRDDRSLFNWSDQERQRAHEDPAQRSPRMPAQPLASPFVHHANPIFSASMSPSYDFDAGHYRATESGYRPLQQPPMPPTAQPVNHFANSNMHRTGLLNSPFQHGPPPPWPGTSSSALVALPQGESSMPQSSPYYGMPQYSPYPQQPQMHHHPMISQAPPTPNQYGGPMLAPAAGQLHAPQPAFAQQIGRQEQSRRRNTEVVLPRFKEYRGPH